MSDTVNGEMRAGNDVASEGAASKPRLCGDPVCRIAGRHLHGAHPEKPPVEWPAPPEPQADERCGVPGCRQRADDNAHRCTTRDFHVFVPREPQAEAAAPSLADDALHALIVEARGEVHRAEGAREIRYDLADALEAMLGEREGDAEDARNATLWAEQATKNEAARWELEQRLKAMRAKCFVEIQKCGDALREGELGRSAREACEAQIEVLNAVLDAKPEAAVFT